MQPAETVRHAQLAAQARPAWQVLQAAPTAAVCLARVETTALPVREGFGPAVASATIVIPPAPVTMEQQDPSNATARPVPGETIVRAAQQASSALARMLPCSPAAATAGLTHRRRQQLNVTVWQVGHERTVS
jgi:hypothetical protein